MFSWTVLKVNSFVPTVLTKVTVAFVWTLKNKTKPTPLISVLLSTPSYSLCSSKQQESWWQSKSVLTLSGLPRLLQQTWSVWPFLLTANLLFRGPLLAYSILATVTTLPFFRPNKGTPASRSLYRYLHCSVFFQRPSLHVTFSSVLIPLLCCSFLHSIIFN